MCLASCTLEQIVFDSILFVYIQETISEDINSVNTTTPTRSIETEESKLFLKMVHGIKGKDDIYPKDWVADINNSVIQLW